MVRSSSVVFLFLKRSTRMRSAQSRASCQGEWSRICNSSKGVSRFALAMLRVSGTGIPKKLSPSPYSPGPVLKKRLKCAAFSVDATDRSSSKIKDAVCMKM